MIPQIRTHPSPSPRTRVRRREDDPAYDYIDEVHVDWDLEDGLFDGEEAVVGLSLSRD